MKRLTAIALAASLWCGCVVDGELGDDMSSSRHEVIGGDITPEGLFPATGGLVQFGQVMCTGTLVAPRVVLTAAHCVTEFFPGADVPGFTLMLDGTTLDPAQVIAGTRAVAHPSFNIQSEPPPGVTQWFDIGVLVLASAIDDVPFELLPSVTEAARLLTPDAAVDLVGYGLTEVDGDTAGVKHHGAATLIEAGAFELFIGNGEQQNCNGDSGGPAFMGASDARRLVGIVSRSPDENVVCDHGGIDTRVDPYLDWIAQAAPEICEGVSCDDTGIPRPDPEPEPGPEPDPESENSDGGGGCSTSTSSNGWWLGALGLLLVARRRRQVYRHRSSLFARR